MGKLCIVFLSTLTTLPCHPQFHHKRIITVPVADLRAKPEANPTELKLPTSDLKNPLQITQLLLGEQILVHEQFIDELNQAWFKISTIQQQYYRLPLGWHGYPGWIQADQTIEVEAFPTCNLAVNSYLAEIFDQNGEPIFTVSIGTRLLGEHTISLSHPFIIKNPLELKLWQITLPNGKIGFIKDSDVYYIDQTVQESQTDLRQSIVATAIKFLGNWYSWGGRSAQCDEFGISSVDCSALVGLSFLAHGLQLPRMSHEQFLRCNHIEYCSDLQMGDLIFFSSITKQSARMDHVMMFLGGDALLEATVAADHKTRIVSFQKRMGTPCNGTLRYGDIVHDQEDSYFVYFGSFLNNPSTIQELRNHALQNEYDNRYIALLSNYLETLPQECYKAESH